MWTVENATITVEREERAKEGEAEVTSGKQSEGLSVLTLWVWLSVGRRQLSEGTQVASGARCGFLEAGAGTRSSIKGG